MLYTEDPSQKASERWVLHPLGKIGRMSKLDNDVAAAAALQDNVISRRAILAIKGTDEWIESRLDRKIFQTLFAGVYLMGAAAPTWRQWVRAALVAAGEGARVSHRTAAALRGVQGAPEGPIDITVPDSRDIDLKIVGHEDLERPAIRVFRSRRVETRRSFAAGIPATSVERMLVDYAAVSSRLEVERAVEDVLNRGLSKETRVWRGLIEHGGRGVRGTKSLRRVLMTRPSGRPAKSILEIFLGHALFRFQLSGSIRNHPVTVDGRNYEIDRVWLREMVALEADSKAWHGTATVSQKDREKTAALESIGFTVLRTNWDEVVNHPDRLVERLRSALHAFCEGSPVSSTENPSQKRAG